MLLEGEATESDELAESPAGRTLRRIIRKEYVHPALTDSAPGAARVGTSAAAPDSRCFSFGLTRAATRTWSAWLLAIPRRIGVIARRHCIGVTDTPIPTVDPEFPAAATSKNLTRAVDRRSLCGRMVATTLTTRLDDVPAAAGVWDDMSSVLAHLSVVPPAVPKWPRFTHD